MNTPSRTNWWRARLRASRTAALTLGALVLVTAFLAAAFPRAREAYETDGVRHALGSVPPAQRTMDITVSRADLTGGDPAAAYAAPELARQDRAIRGQFAAPLRIDGNEAVYGVRTTKAPAARDAWLPRPDGLTPSSPCTRPPAWTGTPPSPGGGCRMPRGRGRAPWRRRSPSPPPAPSGCTRAVGCIWRG